MDEETNYSSDDNIQEEEPNENNEEVNIAADDTENDLSHEESAIKPDDNENEIEECYDEDSGIAEEFGEEENIEEDEGMSDELFSKVLSELITLKSRTESKKKQSQVIPFCKKFSKFKY
jgi:hypothetical protein